MIIIDSFSDDGSYELLEEYSGSVNIHLTRKRCSRGVGRQMAYQMSAGDYVVTFDLDTIYNANWRKLIDWVLRNDIPFPIFAVYSQLYPRWALDLVGGWRDFQYWEDVDLGVRLANKGLYREYPMVCGDNLKRIPARDGLEKILRLYAKARDYVAICDWIPFRLYTQGHLMLLRRSPRLLYGFLAFLLGYSSGILRRAAYCRDGYDTSLMRSSNIIEIDCGIVPREQLRGVGSPYETAELCRAALSRGDVGFLPLTPD